LTNALLEYYLRVAATTYCTALLLSYGTVTRPAASASDVILVTHSKPPTAATFTGCCTAATSVFKGLVNWPGFVTIAGDGTIGCCRGRVVVGALSQPVAMTWMDAVAWAVAAPPSGTAVAVLVICMGRGHVRHTYVC
jgi:hypothetical protein